MLVVTIPARSYTPVPDFLDRPDWLTVAGHPRLNPCHCFWQATPLDAALEILASNLTTNRFYLIRQRIPSHRPAASFILDGLPLLPAEFVSVAKRDESPVFKAD
jgi:hypothetical protein